MEKTTMEKLPQSHENKAVEDESNQVIALVTTKIEESIQTKNQSSGYTVGLPIIEFPKFSGDGFNDWKYRCEKWFELYKTGDDVKVKVASIHLDGNALQWHRAQDREGTITNLPWVDYAAMMESKFEKKQTQSGNTTTSIHTRRICKMEEMSKLIKEHHFRFGPLYKRDEHPQHPRIKDDAWKHLLKQSPERDAATTEKYLLGMRNVEDAARRSYPECEVDDLSGPEFRWMMIKDGCFFLQLAFHVLGASQQLGYLDGHHIFDKKKSRKHKDIKELIEAMFFVGNQVPMVVLNELMKQTYFQKVIKEKEWNQSPDLSKIALYELLVLPALQLVHYTVRLPRPRWWCSSKARADSRARWLRKQKPCDLLHGLQLLVLGPKNERENGAEDEKEEEEEEDDDTENQDLEAQHNLRNAGENDAKNPSFSATDFKNIGIHFRPLSIEGSRGIQFTNTKLLFKAFPILYLPPLLVGDDTELLFQCLRNYEMSQRLSKSKQEVSSYLFFMSQLLQTSEDAKLIGNKGILKGESKQKSKVPGMLKRLALAPEESYNQNLRRVMLQTRDYSTPPWTRYWHIISLALIVTVLQTVYTILPYYTRNEKRKTG